MGKICRRISIFLLLIFVLNGCSDQKDEPKEIDDEPPKKTEILDNGQIEISIYGMDKDTFELKDYIAVIAKDQLNATMIVQEVIKVFAEGDVQIGLDKVTQKGEDVYVSFNKRKVPAKGVSKKVEQVILDAISNSLLDNVENCKKVYFQIEGGEYKTKNIELDLETPYSW